MNIENYFKDYQELARKLDQPEIKENLEKAIEAIFKAFSSGNKLLIAGNGGSAADSQHFAGEFIGRFKKERNPYPAISLTTDTSILTAWSNDYDFKTVFSRQLEALGQKGDVFVSFSTSGNSVNLMEALAVANKKELNTIAFLGGSGGKMKGLSDIELIVPSGDTPRIQEVHTFFMHLIAGEVEARMVQGN